MVPSPRPTQKFPLLQMVSNRVFLFFFFARKKIMNVSAQPFFPSPPFALLLGVLPSTGGGPMVTQGDRTDTVAEAPSNMMHPLGQRMQPALLQLRRKRVAQPRLLLQYIAPPPSFALLLGVLPSTGGGPMVTQGDRTDTVAEAPTSVNGKAHVFS